MYFSKVVHKVVLEQTLDMNVSDRLRAVPMSENMSSSGERLPGVLTDNVYTIVLYVTSYMGVFLSITGVVSNVINIKTFTSIGVKDGVTVSFLGLAVSDLLASFFLFFSFASTALDAHERHYGWRNSFVDPYSFSVYFSIMGSSMHLGTVLTTVYIAVARCMSVSSPIHFRLAFTRTQSMAIIAIFNALSISTTLPIFANMGLVKKFYPVFNDSRYHNWYSPDRERIKDAVFMMSQTIVPFSAQVVLIVCIFVMRWHLLKSIKFRQGSSSTSTASNERVDQSVPNEDAERSKSGGQLTGKELKIVKQVILISGVLIMCNLPAMVSSVTGIIEPGFDLPASQKRYYRFYISAQLVRRVFGLVNGSVNIFFYLRYNSKFRKQFKQHCRIK